MLKYDCTVDGTPIANLTDGSMKEVVLVCDSCGVEKTTGWHNYVQYQRKRGWTGSTSCQPCAVRATSRRNKGRRNKHVAARNSRQGGSKHPNWKGGRYVAHDGYVMVSVVQGRTSKSGWSNYRKEHIVVIEEHLGRELTRKEVVHHVDGDKQNNALSNLWVSSQSEHRKAHISLQDIGFLLVKSGLVAFDPDLGVYIVADVKLRELLEQPGEANQQPSLDGDILEGSETRE